MNMLGRVDDLDPFWNFKFKQIAADPFVDLDPFERRGGDIAVDLIERHFLNHPSFDLRGRDDGQNDLGQLHLFFGNQTEDDRFLRRFRSFFERDLKVLVQASRAGKKAEGQMSIRLAADAAPDHLPMFGNIVEKPLTIDEDLLFARLPVIPSHLPFFEEKLPLGNVGGVKVDDLDRLNEFGLKVIDLLIRHLDFGDDVVEAFLTGGLFRVNGTMKKREGQQNKIDPKFFHEKSFLVNRG